MRILLCYFFGFLYVGNIAQIRQDHAAGILQKIKKLRVAGSVLYVAAHPDDENTRLLSYLSNEKQFRTAYLSLTRGEGGQNLIGKEQGAALGLIRTQELLAARRTDGAEQYFSRAADFGFSKNPEETFAFWNRDSVLADMVLVIRRLKPQVIICRFPPTSEGGHGHHTASAILALEAYEAAADSTRFPEQLKYYSTWKTQRIYWNTYNFSRNTIGPGQFSLDVGGYNPLLGKSYGEIAAESRSNHKSQGFGTIKQRGSSLEYFKLFKGDSVGADIFSGIDSRLVRFKLFKSADKLMATCEKNFDPEDPEKSVKTLIRIHQHLTALKTAAPEEQYWITQKLSECGSLIIACSGLWLEAVTSAPYSVPGNDLKVNISALNRGGLSVKLKQINSVAGTIDAGTELKPNITHTFEVIEKTRETFSPTRSFWLGEKESAVTAFNLSEDAGKRAATPALKYNFILEAEGYTLEAERELLFKKGDPVKGEIYEPFYFVPPVDISFTEKVYVFSRGEKKKVVLKIRAFSDNINGNFLLSVPEGWSAEVPDNKIFLKKQNEETLKEVWITAGTANGGTLGVSVDIDGKSYNNQIDWVEYDHIPRQLMSKKAGAVLSSPSIIKGVNKIGYIQGAGDEVAERLRAAGYHVTLLKESDLEKSTLQQYDAIVSGIRAFNVNEELHHKMPALLDYVANGGNLVIQYNTNSRVGPLDFVPGPYPFKITRARTTDEKADVTFVLPLHPVLNQPNKISREDFENWVQERGIYYATEADERYQKPFLMNDAGEDPLDGSLIITRHGKGNFVYTGLAFFRQLPAGVPGAFRLFANILSLPTEK